MEPRELSQHSNKPRAGRIRNRSLTFGRARSCSHLNIVQICWDQSSLIYKGYWGLFTQGNKADHSSLCRLYSAEVTYGIAVPPLLPHMSSWHRAQLMNPSATLALSYPPSFPSLKNYCIWQRFSVVFFIPSWQIL
jgi:hypothetical protein